MNVSRTVSLALVGLFVWVTGCTSYKQIEIGEVADYDHVRVTMTDGERQDLYGAVVEADSIRGRENREARQYYSDLVLIIPLDQVSAIESAHGDAAKFAGMTLLVLAGIGAVGFVTLLIATAAM